MTRVIDGSAAAPRLAFGLIALILATAAVYFLSEDAIWWPRRSSGGSSWIQRTSSPGFFWAGVSLDAACALAFAWLALRGDDATQQGMDERRIWNLRNEFIGSALFALVFAGIVAACLLTGRAGMPGVATASWSTQPVKFSLLLGLFTVIGAGFASVACASWRALHST